MSSSDSKTKRIRPWRCTLCADRFAHEQDPALGHRTVYAPRDWERRKEAS